MASLLYIGVFLILSMTLFASLFYLFTNNGGGLLNKGSNSGSNLKTRNTVHHNKLYNNGNATFLLVGPCNAGKSSLTHRLRCYKSPAYVSTKELPPMVSTQVPVQLVNFFFSKEPRKSYNVIDFPGHIKARYQLEEYIQDNKNLKGLVFLMDSTDNGDKLDATVELLFETLNLLEKNQNSVDVLIACNKSDLFASRPEKKVQEQLELKLKELIVRKKKSVATKMGSGPSQNDKKYKSSNNYGNANDEDGDAQYAEHLMNPSFTFQDLDGSFDSISGSVLQDKTSGWIDWMLERM